MFPFRSFRLLRQPHTQGNYSRPEGKLRWLAAWGLALLFTPVAHAHEFWLVPDNGLTREGREVELELRIGPTWPGVQTSRLPGLVRWFRAHDAEGVREVADVAHRQGASAVGHITARAAGSLIVAMRSNSRRVELPAPEFNQYLEEEGLTRILALREKFALMDAPGRELYSRCAKSIIAVDGQSRGFDRVVNLPLELIPLTDPMSFRPGTPFVVQVLLHGQPLPGILVKAQLRANPVIEKTVVSNKEGRVAFNLAGPGMWLFNAVHMDPGGQGDVDWESLWSSLTMELPPLGYGDRS